MHTNIALEDLELKVVASEEAFENKLRQVEMRLNERIDEQLKSLVHEQLRNVGFDPDLTASALPADSLLMRMPHPYRPTRKRRADLD